MLWLSIFGSVSSILGIAAVVILTLAFWKLNVFAPTPATRIGLVSSLICAGIWLVFGMLWVVFLLPGDLSSFVGRIYAIPFLWQAVGLTGTACETAAMLCLAWTLYRGIHRPLTTP